VVEEARKRGPDSAFARYVDEVRSAGDLVSLVSSYVNLQRSGSRLKGLCPFHQERTPSFYVDEVKQLFYCFGCSKGGDAFKFLMLQEKVDFPEAVRLLGEKHGIRRPERDAAGSAARERLSAALEAAGAFYRDRLLDGHAGRAARAYLEKRGVTGETAHRLGLGYAPPGWESLRGALGSRFPEQVLVEAGLQVRREGGGAYDRFRDRVVFPIRSVSGKCVGFGGRALGDEEPKYLNSPESTLYRKGEHLFGLEATRQAVRARGVAVLVEGYMDFASAYQAGVENVAATLGTAFTDAQAALLRRFSSRVVLNFDSDAAGRAAVRRALDKLLPLGLAARVLELPGEHDPDSFVREAGAEAYRRQVESAPAWFEQLLARVVHGRNLAEVETRVTVVEELAPLIKNTPNRLERAAHVALLAQRIGVDEQVLRSELRRGTDRQEAGRQSALRQQGPSEASPAELRLVRLMLDEPGWQARWLGRVQATDFDDLRLQRIVALLAEGLEQSQPATLGDVLKRLGDEPARDLLARLGVDPAPEASAEEAEACVQALERRRLQRERRLVQQQMEREKDPVRIDLLMERKIRISKQIDALS
jgi:DNA primase